MTINAKLKEKVLTLYNNETFLPVGDNSDYIIHFDIADSDRKTAMFAKFVRSGREQEISLDEDGNANIPLWVLKEGYFKVGLTADGFSSTPMTVGVKESINNEKLTQTQDPEPEKIDMLTELVNKIKWTKGVYIKDGHLFIVQSDGTETDCGAVQVDPGTGGLFYVTLTQDSEGNYTADKTFDEIKAAYAENKEIIVYCEGSFFRLVSTYPEPERMKIMFFSAMIENTHGMLFCNATKWVFNSFTFVTKDSIVQEISESSLSGKIPSAKAVYTAIQSAIGNAPVFEYLTEETTEEIPCTGLTLEPDILSFSGSGQQTIIATALPADTTDSVTWLSSDKNVATVSNGIVTAVGNGDCTITATCGSQSASCSVNVSGISTVVSVTGVTLDKATASVDTGSTVMLTATIEPSNASNQNISWSSDNETVATVENGTVTGVSAGTATIGVMTEDGGYSAVCNVTVNEVVVSEYRNLFDKDTMVTANQGIPSTGVIGSYTWGLARVPVQENSQYSYKTVEDYADNERTYYGGATAGCIGFADSNGEIISRLSFAITQAQLDATDNNGLNCLLRDYTHGEIPEGEAYPKGFGWVTFTTPAGCAYLLFNTTLKNNADKIQLEAGDTIHNYYLPYSGGVE